MPARISFDIFYWQIVPWARMVEEARYIESLPVQTLWIGDTYAMPERWAGQVLEAWSTLAALAMCTKTLRLGTLVSDVPLRHPAMLAKTVATVDQISGGRVDLGVGAGDNMSEERQYLGLPDLSPAQRVDRLTEAVTVINDLFRGRPCTFKGDYYQLESAPLVPTPVQKPRPALTISAQGKRVLKLAAEQADTCVTAAWGASDEDALHGVEERNRLLDDYCSKSGRDPESLQRACLFGWSDLDPPFASREGFQSLVGRYREAGVNRFVVCLGGEDTPEPYKRWVTGGQWVTREKMEAYVADEMKAMSS